MTDKYIYNNSGQLTEKTATVSSAGVISGGTAGYLWGTDGTNGVLRVDTSISMTKDSANAYITLAANVIDCGAI